MTAKLLLIFSILFFVNQPVDAIEVAHIYCQVIDAAGKAYQEPVSFFAYPRNSTSMQVTRDGILRLRWPYEESALKITMEYNPNYPSTNPFSIEELGYVEIKPNENGQIDGVVSIDPILQGFSLSCRETQY